MSVGVAILGSTGSIGCSTLQVLARQQHRFRVTALTGHSNVALLERQAAEWRPAYVGIVNGGMRDAGCGGQGNASEFEHCPLSLLGELARQKKQNAWRL